MMCLRRQKLAALLIGCGLLLAACGRPAGAPGADISRTPPPADYSFLGKQPVQLVKPAKEGDPYAVELRHHDLSSMDLSQAGEVLFGYASFDMATKWPAALPAGYDPQKIMALGREPGLGVRQLHKEGITGKGIRVAFLDQTLLVDHTEYKEQLEAYREIGKVPDGAQMHAPAVVSILAGKSLGVAPGVALTFYNVQHVIDGKVTWVNHAKAITEILDANAKLPAEKIRVIGVSLGYSQNTAGFEEIKAVVARAKKEGVLVLTTSVETDYTFKFHGLGRDPLADPEDVNAYRPGNFWAAQFYANPEQFTDRILVPMDSRTTADPTGANNYAFYRTGGWSWVVPYLEGVYAMGLQVKPDLTPEEFYKTALATGSYTSFDRDGKTYKLGPILNPVALIRKLQGK